MDLLVARRDQIPVDDLPRNEYLFFPVCDPLESFLGFANPFSLIPADRFDGRGFAGKKNDWDTRGAQFSLDRDRGEIRFIDGKLDSLGGRNDCGGRTAAVCGHDGKRVFDLRGWLDCDQKPGSLRIVNGLSI